MAWLRAPRRGTDRPRIGPRPAKIGASEPNPSCLPDYEKPCK